MLCSVRGQRHVCGNRLSNIPKAAFPADGKIVFKSGFGCYELIRMSEEKGADLKDLIHMLIGVKGEHPPIIKIMKGLVYLKDKLSDQLASVVYKEDPNVNRRLAIFLSR